MIQTYFNQINTPLDHRRGLGGRPAGINSSQRSPPGPPDDTVGVGVAVGVAVGVGVWVAVGVGVKVDIAVPVGVVVGVDV